MTGPIITGGSGSKSDSAEYDDPLYLHPSDNTTATIIGFKLVGTENFRIWKNSMTRALKGRNKLGFAEGSVAKPVGDVTKCQKWERANAVVCSWILGSLSEPIYASHASTEHASDMWSELYETYHKSDGSVIFNIHQKINSLTQNSLSVSDYYNKLDALWKEFDGLTNLPECVCEAAARYNDHSKLIKLMQFLNGLEGSFNQVKSHILLMEPLPNVRTAFSIISREESFQKNGSLSQSSEKTQPTAFNSRFNKVKSQNQNFQCKHCGLKGHTIERCYKLIGYPKDFKQKNNNSSTSQTNFGKTYSNNNANACVTESSSSITSLGGSSDQHFLTSDQYSKFLRLISEGKGVEEVPVNANMAGIACNSVATSKKWVVDSGANQHMTASGSNLCDTVDVSRLNLRVGHPNGSSAKIDTIGNLPLTNSLTLFDVFVVPDFNVNLLSVHKLCKDTKCDVVFNEHNCFVQDSQSKGTVETGNESGGLYYIDSFTQGIKIPNTSFSKCFVSKFTWHSRLGHPAEQALNVLKVHLNLDNGLLPPCEICHRAKQTRESFPISQNVSTKVGELIHIDVWGPYRINTFDGFKYFLTIVDDYSRATWIYLLRSKDEVYNCFMSFNNLLENQFSVKVKCVRSDNGTEFVNNKMKLFFETKGILHQTSCVHTPQQNGVVERKHRHILNVARSLIFESGLPLKYWGEAILTAVFLINRTPSSVLKGQTPFELIYKRLPKLDHLRVFGCLCFATRLNISDKFSDRAEKSVLIGYSAEKKGYKLLSLDSGVIFFSRDVKFYETIFPFKMNSSQSVVSQSKDPFSNDESDFSDNVTVHKDIGSLDATRGTDGSSAVNSLDSTDYAPSCNQGKDSHTPQFHLSTGVGENTSLVCNQDDEVSLPQSDVGVSFSPSLAEENCEDYVDTTQNQSSGYSRPRRESRLPTRFNDFILSNKHKYSIDKSVNYSFLNTENKCFATNLNKTVEPQSFFEASSDPSWVKAMNEEMEALYRNKTWVVTDLPSNRKPIGCKWVYKIKYKANGEVERYKARLVAKGFNQREGIDFEETFSPVAKMVTIRLVITLVVNSGWSLFQLDINNAFLYGNLDVDVYMSQPQGYHTVGDVRVCKLLKSLYGLKQAPRKWNERLCASLFEFGFKQSLNDYSLFVYTKCNFVVVLLVYVDDIILTGNSVSEITKVKDFLKTHFLIKDLGKLKYFLGIEVIDVEHGVCLTQRKYCLELLHEFGMLACKPVKTPLEANCVIGQNDNDYLLQNITEFQKLIGKLIYLTITRPDIAYTVQTLSQFMHSPRKSHLDIAFRLLRYLKLNPGCGVRILKSDSLDLKGYVDADWAKCLNTRRSVTGYAVYLGGSLISWKSKKQDTVSRSSTESEYRALGSVTCEVIWILKVLFDLGKKELTPVNIFCDNESAIKLALNPVFHEKTKHFEVDVHFVREKISKGILKVEKILSKNQRADILTKALPVSQHSYLCLLLGLIDPFQGKL